MAGTYHYTIAFAVTNTGTSACTLRGYPRLTHVHPSGATDRMQTIETTDSPVYHGLSTAAVTLQPGSAAQFYLAQLGNPEAAPTACAALDRVVVTTHVTVPGGGPDLVSPVKGYVCPNDNPTVYVSPFVAASANPNQS